MFLTLLFLPFFGSFVSGFFGKFIGAKGSCFITTFCLFSSAFLSIISFYEVGLNGSFCYIKLMPWMNVELFNVSWGFLFDSLTVIMLVVVTFISSLVHLYSTEYMCYDPHLSRFMSYLSLFTFFMLILVSADNYIQMFVGWEGIGLCSYLLINFWFTRIQANKAAIKAMIMNRIGDFGLALAIILIFTNFQSVDYCVIFSLVLKYKNFLVNFLGFEIHLLTLLGILLFIGAVGKSAQLGLHTWLPDAMEGPTPVSALIHAATLVTAGVFLIARSSLIFEFAPTASATITIFGAMTCFFAATTGLLQNDLKKVIAYSTCSQLGYMVFACGVSNYSVSVFHLANHAFFKALLFLGAGSVIHAVSDEQDMRKMGGLKKVIPFTYAMMLIGSFSLSGFPFLTGFYSKDVILEVSFAKYTIFSHFSYWLGSFGAFFTAFYSIRLTYLTFLSLPNGFRPVIFGAHESPWKMLLPLIVLSVPSIFIGFFTKDIIIGVGTDFWGTSIFTKPENFNLIEAEFANFFNKILPLCLSFFGACLSFFLYTFFSEGLFGLKKSWLGNRIYNFLNRKWFFDKVYVEVFGQNFLSFAFHGSYKVIDRGLIEFFGPAGLSFSVYKNSLFLSYFQSGFLYHYSFLMLIGLSFILIFFQIWNFFFSFFSIKLLFILFFSIFFI